MNLQAPLQFALLSSTAFMMAAVAGFADVIGFVGVNKLFTAHITGNIVIAISELIHHEAGVASKILSIPLFIAIVILLTMIIEICGQSKRLLASCLFIEALLLIAFLFAGIYIFPYASISSWEYIGGGMLAVATMAIHNTLLRTFMVQFPPCTVMTGNLTQFIVETVSYAWGWKKVYALEKRSQSLAGIHRAGNVLCGFLLGGALAAVGYILFNFWIVLAPIAVLLFMVAIL